MDNTDENMVCFFCMSKNDGNMTKFALSEKTQPSNFLGGDFINALQPAMGKPACMICLHFFKTLKEGDLCLKNFFTMDIHLDPNKRKQSFIRLHNLFFMYYRNCIAILNSNLIEDLNMEKSPYTPASLELSSENESEEENGVEPISRGYNNTPVLVVVSEQPYNKAYEDYFEKEQSEKVEKQKKKHKGIDTNKKCDNEVARFMSKPRGFKWTHKKGERQSRSRMKKYNNYINTPGIEHQKRYSAVDLRTTSALSYSSLALSRASITSTLSEPLGRNRKSYGTRAKLPRIAKEKTLQSLNIQNKRDLENDNSINSLTKTEPKIVCAKCSIELNSVDAMNEHKIDDHGMIPRYHCSYCRKKFVSRNEFEIHNATHEQVEIICSLCHLTLINKKEIANHLYEHSVFDILCRFCDRSFVLRKHLAAHVVNDHGVRNHKLISRVMPKNIFVDFRGKDPIQYSTKLEYKNNLNEYVEYDLIQSGRLFNSPPTVFDYEEIFPEHSNFDPEVINIVNSLINTVVELTEVENHRSSAINIIEEITLFPNIENDAVNEQAFPDQTNAIQITEIVNFSEQIEEEPAIIPLPKETSPKPDDKKNSSEKIITKHGEIIQGEILPPENKNCMVETKNETLKDSKPTVKRKRLRNKTVLLEEEMVLSDNSKKPFLISRKASDFLSKISEKSIQENNTNAQSVELPEIPNNEIVENVIYVNNIIDDIGGELQVDNEVTIACTETLNESSPDPPREDKNILKKKEKDFEEPTDVNLPLNDCQSPIIKHLEGINFKTNTVKEKNIPRKDANIAKIEMDDLDDGRLPPKRRRRMKIPFEIDDDMKLSIVAQKLKEEPRPEHEDKFLTEKCDAVLSSSRNKNKEIETINKPVLPSCSKESKEKDVTKKLDVVKKSNRKRKKTF